MLDILVPAHTYSVSAGTSPSSLHPIANGTVSISAPYNVATAEAIELKLGNLTDVTLGARARARFVSLTIKGSFAADGRGGTLVEFAVIGAAASVSA